MKKNPSISIIVPVYNVEEYLPRCIDSILAQTFTDFELIIVDDGSPDNCGKICDEYEKKDNRIKVIHKENGGLSDARNAGLDIAQGKYIGFVDSDDEIKCIALEVLYNCAIHNRCDIVCSTFGKIIDDRYINNECSNTVEFFDKKRIMKWYSYSKYGYTAWNKLYKTSLFCNIRYPKGRVYEDVATTYKLMDKASKVAYIDQDLFYYRIRETSITHSIFSKKLSDEIMAFEEYYNFITVNYPYLEKRVRIGYLISIYRNLSAYLSMCEYDEDDNFNKWFSLIYKNRFFILTNNSFSAKEKIAFLKIFLGKKVYCFIEKRFFN